MTVQATCVHTYHAFILTSYREVYNKYVVLGSSTAKPLHIVGTKSIILNDLYILTSVLHVPDLNAIASSEGKLDKEGLQIVTAERKKRIIHKSNY